MVICLGQMINYSRDIRLLCDGVKPPVVRQSFVPKQAPSIGVLMYPPQCLIILRQKQRTNRVRNLEVINKSMQRVKLHDMVGDVL